VERRRVDVEPDRPPVRIPASVLQELCVHALESRPEECCGLIVGNELTRYRRLFRCRNEMTAMHRRDPEGHPRDGRAAFYMNEHDYMKVRDEAEQAGELVTAVYHSHVGAGAYLSPMDLDYAENPLFPFPDAAQIVVPVFDRTVHDIGIFLPGVDGFVGHVIEREAPDA
jgi:proteasome lid subunit RPN8/RPN11